MHKQIKELQQLKGVGKVLSERLAINGYTTLSRVAAAQTRGLELIPGMHPKKVRSIVTQARELTGEAEKGQHAWTEENGGWRSHRA